MMPANLLEISTLAIKGPVVGWDQEVLGVLMEVDKVETKKYTAIIPILGIAIIPWQLVESSWDIPAHSRNVAISTHRLFTIRGCIMTTVKGSPLLIHSSINFGWNYSNSEGWLWDTIPRCHIKRPFLLQHYPYRHTMCPTCNLITSFFKSKTPLTFG